MYKLFVVLYMYLNDGEYYGIIIGSLVTLVDHIVEAWTFVLFSI